MEKFFKLSKYGTNVKTEVMAGLTTFFTMAYIIFVNPLILSSTGMSRNGVTVATIIATMVGTLILGLVANVPYAAAPGMGLNAFFAYTVCGSLGFAWQEALAMVFICGLINVVITVTKLRKYIIQSIPRSLQLAIGGGIGLFIAYIGMKNAGFLTFSDTAEGVTPGAQIVPVISNFSDKGVLLALFGLILITVLMILKVKGAMLIGIVVSTILALIMGITSMPEKAIDMSAVGDVKEVAFSFFGSPGFGSLFSEPSRILPALMAIFAFSISDTFDTIGTFIGTGNKTGIFDNEDEQALANSKGFSSRMDKALFADSTATSIGALFGTSNTTTYVESAAGIGVGGRTGLTSLVVSLLFLLCLPFTSIIGMVPSQATAPVLIIVGVLMVESFTGIKWTELEESIPAFMTIIFMTLGYSISNGIAAGFLFYCIVKLCKGKAKELHPILIGSTALFILYFIVQAAQG